uniref:Aminotransferase-like plant mobile domain-containing protein n=1 Tax=Medicago truncatula TaxID=3880 RepID=A2Q2G5_MEDTR|nr:hypothetical protein MtrDRAFT_AC150800g10v2 [Medicago truncatula]
MEIFKERLQEAFDAGDIHEMHQKQDQYLCIYLLYLVDITLFTDKSANYMDVICLRYFRDLDLVSDYAWGAVALAHLYKFGYFNTLRESMPGMHEVDMRTINIHVP